MEEVFDGNDFTRRHLENKFRPILQELEACSSTSYVKEVRRVLEGGNAGRCREHQFLFWSSIVTSLPRRSGTRLRESDLLTAMAKDACGVVARRVSLLF